jgi:hypothetical protein
METAVPSEYCALPWHFESASALYSVSMDVAWSTYGVFVVEPRRKSDSACKSVHALFRDQETQRLKTDD